MKDFFFNFNKAKQACNLIMIITFVYYLKFLIVKAWVPYYLQLLQMLTRWLGQTAAAIIIKQLLVMSPHPMRFSSGKKSKLVPKKITQLYNDHFIRCLPPIVNSESTNFFHDFFILDETFRLRSKYLSRQEIAVHLKTKKNI